MTFVSKKRIVRLKTNFTKFYTKKNLLSQKNVSKKDFSAQKKVWLKKKRNSAENQISSQQGGKDLNNGPKKTEWGQKRHGPKMIFRPKRVERVS